MLIHYTNISESPRQRKKIESRPLSELAESIRQKGLMHPIVVHSTDPNKGPPYTLIAGGRRLAAIKALHDAKRTPLFGTFPMEKGQIYATIFTDKDLPFLLEMELEENTIRLDLEWQERVEALAGIEAARVALAASRQEPVPTRTQLAKDIQAQQLANTGITKSLPAIQNDVTKALTVANALANRPDLAKARSVAEAYGILLREKAEHFEGVLAKRRLTKIAEIDQTWDVHLGDFRSIIPTLSAASVDLVIADPPYGIDIDKEKYAAGIWHRYVDTPEAARTLGTQILQLGWHISKPRANLFMFCHWTQFEFLQAAAARFGWSPWFDPIIWRKSITEGSAPWGRLGFIHTYEVLLFATKGQRGVNGPIMDVLDFNKVANKSRVHGAEKPLGLLEFLIDKASFPGDLVLDPCCGSGSTLLAAVRRGRKVVGIEIDPIYYDRTMSRMHNYEEERTGAQSNVG